MSFIAEKKWLCRILFLEFIVVASYCNAKLCVAYTEVMLVIWSLFGAAELIVWVRKRRKYKKAPRWWVFYKCMDLWLGQALALLFAISLCFGVVSLAEYAERRIKYDKITISEAEEVLVEHQGRSILEHADLLEQLSPELYRNLSLQEKANVLGRMIQIEAEYLGIEAPDLQIRVLDGNTVGYYIKEENLVLLNEKYLPYEETTLTGVLHEMYHAYQYACVTQLQISGELLFLRQVEQWRTEYAAYESAQFGQNYFPYYLQEMESSAREYAEERLEEYGKLIVLGNTP